MDMTVASALWAMHPDFLAAQLRSGTIDAMLPDSLRGVASLMGGQPQQAKQADPIRDGATIIIPITGTLAPRGLSGSTYYDVIADRVREAGADAKIGAVVLAIRSPGGYVWGCAEAGDAIYEVRQSKPVIAVSDPYCFSAAYWLGSQGSGFYCTTSGEVGSVGIRSGHTDVSGFEDKIGMKTTLIASHEDKIAGHPYAPLDDAARAEIQASVDESNAAFAAAIARGRGIKASEVAAIHGTGKTFSAKQALANGAIDGVATLRDVVSQYNSSRNRLALMRRQAAAMEMALSI